MIRGLEGHDLAAILRPKPQRPPATAWSPPETRERCVRELGIDCECVRCRRDFPPMFEMAGEV